MLRKNAFFRPVHQAVDSFLIVAAILGALAAIFMIRWVIIAILIGIGLGTLLIPSVEFLHRRIRMPKPISSIVLLLVFFGFFFAVGYFLVSMISDEVLPLMKKLPEAISVFQVKFIHFAHTHPGAQQTEQNFDFQKYLGDVTGALLSGLKTGASAIAWLILSFFVALYYSIRPDIYIGGFVSAFPAHLRSKVMHMIDDSSRSLRRWFLAQLLAMAIVAVVASVVLKIAGSPYWHFFGAITFVLELVPYFGAWTALITITLVTAAGDPSGLVRTVVAFGLVLFLEGYVIMPLVMKGRVQIPPIYLLALLTVMGEWFGIPGLLMATPMFMVLRIIYQKAYLPLMDRQKRSPNENPHPKPAIRTA